MKVKRPWGNFQLLTMNEKTTVKILNLISGNRTSLQLHQNRSEKWFVLDGEGLVFLDKQISVKPHDIIFIPSKTPHRLQAVTDMTILEISYGQFDESDIKRLEDDYQRLN